MQLVEKHNISEKSYGDAIKQIYKLLGDNELKRQRERQTDRQTDRQTETKREKERDRQTDRQTESNSFSYRRPPVAPSVIIGSIVTIKCG